ncbi:MAG: hypothetical protein ACYCTE_05255, partial [Acidimicrobiales bacterium]
MSVQRPGRLRHAALDGRADPLAGTASPHRRQLAGCRRPHLHDGGGAVGTATGASRQGLPLTRLFGDDLDRQPELDVGME